MSTPLAITIDQNKPFQFIEMIDTGPESGACCPHCGADGRYIYKWAEFGNVKGAMAGCYAGLTGHLSKDDTTKFMERLAEKTAKNKPLNGFYKTVQRMQKYIQDNINDAGKVSWAQRKIYEAVSENKKYSFKH